MSTQKGVCGSCAYYAKPAPATGPAQFPGLCKRYPPVPFAIQQPQADGNTGTAIMAFYPPAQPAEWCGEHRQALLLAH